MREFQLFCELSQDFLKSLTGGFFPTHLWNESESHTKKGVIYYSNSCRKEKILLTTCLNENEAFLFALQTLQLKYETLKSYFKHCGASLFSACLTLLE